MREKSSISVCEVHKKRRKQTQNLNNHKFEKKKMITTSRKLCLFITLGGILGVISSCIKGDSITPDENSCCQQKVCNIPCPSSLDKPSKGR